MKLPAVLAFTLLGGGALLGAVASCESHGGTHDARKADAGPCVETCVHDDPAQEPCGCAGAQLACSTGCYACSLFCIPASSDAGAAACPACAARDGTCPDGCRPVG